MCVLDTFFIPVNSQICFVSTEQSRCYRTELLLLAGERVDDVCTGISGCWSALSTNQSDWNQQGRLELYAGFVVQKVSLNVLSRRFEQQILNPEPTSRSIASKFSNDVDHCSLNNVMLKCSSDRRTGLSSSSWCWTSVRTCYVQENIVVQS